MLKCGKQKKSPKEIVQNLGLKKISDPKELSNLVEEVINQFPKQVQDYKNGRTKIFGFFVGEVMKKSRGQADPKQLNIILKQNLKPNWF